MLTESNTMFLKNLSGKGGDLELSFDISKPDAVKVSLGEEVAYVSFDELFAFVFLVSGEEGQTDLLPVRKTTITKYHRQHTVKVKKAMNPGDTIVVNCSIDVPTTVEEGLAGILKKRKGGILRV